MEKLGVIGKPSDWLIASDVDYETAKKVFGVELIDIPIERVKARLTCMRLFRS